MIPIRKLSAFFLLIGCHLTRAQNRDTLCLIQLNDVYEIAALQGGKSGGMARIAYFLDSCRKQYPTYAFMAGDFLSPSVMGTAVVDGERVAGKQMIELLNAIGLDYATFGNHEFDISENALQKRIDESRFTWFSSNVSRSGGTPFYQEKEQTKTSFPKFIRIQSPQKQVQLSFFAITLPSNTPAYTTFSDYPSAIEELVNRRRNRKELLVGLTHVSAREDQELAIRFPSIALIMGGHEHENMRIQSGKTVITKADANGKTVYRHLIWRNKKGRPEIKSDLIRMDSNIPQKKEISLLVANWEEKVFESFRKNGLEPNRSVCVIRDTLRGMENSIRYQQNNLGALVNRALVQDSKASISFINSGAIRIDDNVTGAITELDVIRIMPFGNKIIEMEIRGDLLQKILETNTNRKGSGGFLQYHPYLTFRDDKLFLQNTPVLPEEWYRIRSIEFLFSGREQGLEFLNDTHPQIRNLKNITDENGTPLDIRLSFIAALKKLYGS